MKTLPKKKKVETVHSIFILASKAPHRLAKSTYLVGVSSKMTPLDTQPVQVLNANRS